ncbi:hypothetical protein QAD02_010170 [Eretmocerus hayati]|uniref:Uncharacterized protein n=1 Tax=Eretmocerus hayati TaxID=131215 RepID=A0ACC2NBG1_9HYME|nr:hypothetical protein QAD02_010170 [Eretmocerus hayati]
MTRRAVPLDGGELSYLVRCVSVENERVIGELMVSRDHSAAELHQCGIHTPKEKSVAEQRPQQRRQRHHRRMKPNLVPLNCVGPDLFQLNGRPKITSGPGKLERRHSAAITAFDAPLLADCFGYQTELQAKLARSRSLAGEAEETLVHPHEHRIFKCLNQRSFFLCFYQKYPSPPSLSSNTESSPRHEEILASLVDRLLIDIYGPSVATGFGSRSGSDSTTMTWTPPHQMRPHLQKKRLELRGVIELRILIKSLREHINHQGEVLIQQLDRRDRRIAKRNKLYDVVTAYLQAHSYKRSEYHLIELVLFVSQKY